MRFRSEVPSEASRAFVPETADASPISIRSASWLVEVDAVSARPAGNSCWLPLWSTPMTVTSCEPPPLVIVSLVLRLIVLPPPTGSR